MADWILSQCEMGWVGFVTGENCVGTYCSLWGTIAEYAKFESVVTNMAVLNDSGERALSMMDKFYNKIVGDSAEKEKERQDLLQVVQHYRRENPDLLKATLAKK